MRIQHNIAAMNAYRNYNTNTSAVSKNLEKLSSGYKINRAGDDAAGLAISEKMRAQISGLNAASKNVKDGISLVKTAEGAMQEVQDMLNRMVTLATQSANGTYDNEVDRLNLQKEVDQLRSEINRIADSSNFNGIKLLDGSQEIKTSYNVSSPSDANAMGFKIISDGQLGVDPQAGVFSYDLSQLKITVTEQDIAGTANANAGISTAAWGSNSSLGGAGTSDTHVAASTATRDVTLAFATKAASSGASVSAANATVGNFAKVTIGSKTYTVELVANASAATSASKVAIGTTGSRLSEDAFAKALNEAVNKQIEASNAALASNASASDSYKTIGNVNIGWDGSQFVGGTTTVTTMKPNFEQGEVTTVASKAIDFSGTQAVNWAATQGLAATLNGQTVTAEINGKTYTVELTTSSVAASAAGEGKVQVTASMAGSAVLQKVAAEITAMAQKDADAAKEAGETYTSIASVAISAGSDGSLKIGYKATEMKSNKPAETPASGTKTFTFQVGSQEIQLDLGVGTYSGADIAKMVAEKLNQPISSANTSTPNTAANAGVALAIEDGVMGLADTQANASGEARKLGGAAFTVSVVGSTLTITMDEPPTEEWTEDMTLKFDDGRGNGGEQFKPTVDVEPVDSLTKREYAQATIDLNVIKGQLKDGFSIQLGKTTYTFAIGSDSRFKNSANVVDLTDLTTKDFADGNNRGVIVAANRLSKAAAANSTFLVGSDTKGGISLTEKEGGVDYSVNNLAGDDNKGTSGTGDGKLGGTDATIGDKVAQFDSTLNDWKGLVKIGQGSVTGNGLTLQIGDTSESYNQLVVNIGDIHTKALDIDNVDVSTQAGAQSAVNKIRDAINTVSSIRGTLGATQNRLEHTANNLSVMTENIQDAESTIRDTDIAEEMMSYTKNNILVQSAQAMLAQANQIPQGVLQLLG